MVLSIIRPHYLAKPSRDAGRAPKRPAIGARVHPAYWGYSGPRAAGGSAHLARDRAQASKVDGAPRARELRLGALQTRQEKTLPCFALAGAPRLRRTHEGRRPRRRRAV